jgi:hypothetical protein
MLTMKSRILIATLFVTRAAGFAGLTESANLVASSVPVDLLNSYKHALQQHPLETKMITGGILATMGDALGQSREEDVPYDPRRAASFACFDMAYRALQHNVFPVIVAVCKGQFFLSALSSIPLLAQSLSHVDSTYFAAMEQTLASQLGVVPFLYYPVFFALTGAVQGLTVEGAIERAKENFLPLMERNLLFWIPVQFIQFGFIQEDLQIPFLCMCGLGWTSILSIMAGSTKKYSYCVTGMEDECVLPDELFPVEEMAHEIEEVVHELDEAVHVIEHEFQEIGKEIKHEIEVVVHDINVALHLEEEEETENGTSQQEVNGKSSVEIEAKEEEEALTK